MSGACHLTEENGVEPVSARLAHSSHRSVLPVGRRCGVYRCIDRLSSHSVGREQRRVNRNIETSPFRNQRNRKNMSKGPNKIILLPDDLMFVMPKGSIFTSKVCSRRTHLLTVDLSFVQVNLKNEPHERSNASIRSGDIQAGKTARYNVSSLTSSLPATFHAFVQGDLVEVKKLHIGPLSLRTKMMRELRQLKDLRYENVNTFIGIFIDPTAPALVFEYGQRGSLEVRLTLLLLPVLLVLLALRIFSRRKKSNSIGISNGRC